MMVESEMENWRCLIDRKGLHDHPPGRDWQLSKGLVCGNFSFIRVCRRYSRRRRPRLKSSCLVFFVVLLLSLSRCIHHEMRRGSGSLARPAAAVRILHAKKKFESRQRVNDEDGRDEMEGLTVLYEVRRGRHFRRVREQGN